MKEIDSMYVDTTFCIPEAFYIPSRDDCLSATASLVVAWLRRSPHHYVHVSSRTKYGHEPLLSHLAREAETQVWHPFISCWWFLWNIWHFSGSIVKSTTSVKTDKQTNRQARIVNQSTTHKQANGHAELTNNQQTNRLADEQGSKQTKPIVLSTNQWTRLWAKKHILPEVLCSCACGRVEWWTDELTALLLSQTGLNSLFLD